MPDAVTVEVQIERLETYQDDPCCGKRLAKALLAATEPLKDWTCPKCGVEYRPRAVIVTDPVDGEQIESTVRHWEAVCPVVVFRP